MLAASEAVHGPGIVIAAQSSSDGREAGRITDRDLQVLVNGLWYAGAEAVAINDNRVGTLTSIRTAGDAITVNFRSISSPYTSSRSATPTPCRPGSRRTPPAPTGRAGASVPACSSP